MSKLTKIYVTKYALTAGILVKEVESCSSDGMYKTPNSYGEFYHKGDYELTAQAAINKAYQMKDKKLESLNKQLRKIDEMEFKIDE